MAAPPDASPSRAQPDTASALACPSCGQRFSGDARFCPFDGEPLVAGGGGAADPLLGQIVDGRYEVQTVLGEGGMGTVYAVCHVALGRRFALKVMRPGLTREGHAARFTQEAKAAAAIDHPNVVQITDFGELHDGRPYFVMELLDGEPLSTLIRRTGGLPPERAARILAQVAAGLAAAHAQGVVHRDLKPENIHILARDFVKILDFGLAKVAGGAKITRTGIVFGTPQYMSPEQASGGLVDHRSDIYALGVILYEMLTGRAPFEDESYVGVLQKHLSASPEPPSVVASSGAGLGSLDEVTMRCLEKRPEARYPSADALLKAIEIVWPAEDRAMAPSPPSQRPGAAFERESAPAPTVAPADPGRVRWGPTVVAAAIAFAAVVVFASRSPGPPVQPPGLVATVAPVLVRLTASVHAPNTGAPSSPTTSAAAAAALTAAPAPTAAPSAAAEISAEAPALDAPAAPHASSDARPTPSSPAPIKAARRRQSSPSLPADLRTSPLQANTGASEIIDPWTR